MGDQVQSHLFCFFTSFDLPLFVSCWLPDDYSERDVDNNPRVYKAVVIVIAKYYKAAR